MRSQRLGLRTMRASDERWAPSRKRAITPFAATIRSSMSSRLRLSGMSSRSSTLPSDITGRGSMVRSASAPARSRAARSARVALSWSRSCASSPATAATRGGTGASPWSQGPTSG